MTERERRELRESAETVCARADSNGVVALALLAIADELAAIRESAQVTAKALGDVWPARVEADWRARNAQLATDLQYEHLRRAAPLKPIERPCPPGFFCLHDPRCPGASNT